MPREMGLREEETVRNRKGEQWVMQSRRVLERKIMPASQASIGESM
jgi:hypothetical protein